MTDWQARALRLRAAGHTLLFIAGQVTRQAGVDAGEVIAFLTAYEREQDARQAARDANASRG
jgi:hypothetical protein